MLKVNGKSKKKLFGLLPAAEMNTWTGVIDLLRQQTFKYLFKSLYIDQTSWNLHKIVEAINYFQNQIAQK